MRLDFHHLGFGSAQLWRGAQCGVSSGCGWFRGWLGVVEGVVADHGVQGQDAAVGQGEDGLDRGGLPWLRLRW